MDCFNFITILLQQQDTSAEADGERNLINQKLLLSVFKATGAYIKYAIKMFVSIAQVECLLIALTKKFKRSFFLNWKGGEGNNIEDDLAQQQIALYTEWGQTKPCSQLGKSVKIQTLSQKVRSTLIDLPANTSPVQHSIRDSFKVKFEMINDLI